MFTVLGSYKIWKIPDIIKIPSYFYPFCSESKIYIQINFFTQNATDDKEEIFEKETQCESSKKKIKRETVEQLKTMLLAKATKVMDLPIDNIQILGDYVASELQSLGSEQLQRKLKRLIQKAILEISELVDEEESGTSTPASVPLLSPSYETSSSNDSQFTIQSLNTNYETNTGKVIIANQID